MDRIRITTHNAQRLLDEIDLGLLPEWDTATKISSTFHISRSQVNVWGQRGWIRSRPTGKMFGSKAQLEYSVVDLVNERISRRSLKERKVEEREDGLYVQCTDDDCGKMKHTERDYYSNPGSALGVSTRCKECHNRRGKEWDRSNIDKRNAKKARARKKSVEAAKAASRWQAPKLYPARSVVAIIEERFPDASFAEIELWAGVAVDGYRSIVRSAEGDGKIRVSTIEALLEGLDLNDEMAIIAADLEKGRPAWHPKHPYCVRCYRVSVAHHAKGLCRTCHINRNAPGWKPPIGELGKAWSLRYPSCIECNGTDSRHHARGVCDRCLQRKLFLERRAAEAVKVGSGHGNHRSIQQEAEAPTGGGVGRGHQGRVSRNA